MIFLYTVVVLSSEQIKGVLMKRLISLLFFFSISGGQKTPEIKIRASEELFLASSFLQETGSQQFSIQPPCKVGDIQTLDQLVKCHSQEGFERVLSTLTQKHHARTLLAAVRLGLQPLCDKETHEPLFDRLNVLKSLFYKRVLEDKSLQEEIIPLIESDPEFNKECCQELLGIIPWRADVILTEIDPHPHHARHSFERQFAAGTCHNTGSCFPDSTHQMVFGAVREIPSVNYGKSDLESSNCKLYKLHNNENAQATFRHQQIAFLDTPIEQLASSPCGKFIAYMKTPIVEDNLGNYQYGNEEEWEVEVRDDGGMPVLTFPIKMTGSGKVYFTPTGQLVHTCNKHFEIWDRKTKKQVSMFKVDLSEIGASAVSHDGTKVAFIPTPDSDEPVMEIREVATGELLDTITGFKKIYAVQFTPEGKLFIAGGKEIKDCFVWDASSGKPLADLGGGRHFWFFSFLLF